jgi:hypothetical protein
LIAAPLAIPGVLNTPADVDRVLRAIRSLTRAKPRPPNAGLVENDRDRAVIDELNRHAGAEAARRDVDAEFS